MDALKKELHLLVTDLAGMIILFLDAIVIKPHSYVIIVMSLLLVPVYYEKALNYQNMMQ